jgi:CO dehydrogenase/acetyl-CoA synthase gamma subunit (corrinoid Fe-S protein)
MSKGKKAADLYLLISCLNAGCYAITELEPDKMGSQDKMAYKNLRNFMFNFLKGLERKATKEQIAELHAYNFDNVGAMTELMAIVALIPPTQIEWFLQEVNKLAEESVDRVIKSNEQKKESH